jgi:hypothetical protein
MSDIGESNQRQSDFFWGWNDGEDGRAPRCDREDYMRGYNAGRRKVGLRDDRDDEEQRYLTETGHL